MKRLERKEADKLFDKYWDEMKKEWFKIEVLQDYSGEDDGPSLQQWLKGDKQSSIELMKAEANPEWVESCRQKIKGGVKLIRVHIVDEPPTPYVEWELEHYKYVNIAQCGEQVLLVRKSDVDNLQIPMGDIMIFDDQKAVVNEYDSSGRMTSQTFYDENDDISTCLTLKEQLLNVAKPL